MMDSRSLSAEQVEEWREGPVTRALHGLLLRQLALRKQMALEAYWQGQPWEPAELAGLKAEMNLCADMFESSHDDWQSMAEKYAEFERANSGGV